jgi:hypothetical protein
MTATLGLAALATLLSPAASAGCGGDFRQWSNLPQTTTGPKVERAQFVAASEYNSVNGPSIVGMWNVTFVSMGNTAHNPPIPDGATIDFGYAQWHSDGLEFFNSGGRSPSTQNFCLGVYRKTGFATWELNHLALSYDATTGDLNGKAVIRETITVDETGNTYSGTFTIDVFDPTTGNALDHLAGNITGDRITVDTATP